MTDSPRVLRDRYRLGRSLGRGNGSSTYEAHDLETGEACVVKELSVGEVVRVASGSASFDSDDFTKLIELFEREARVLANLEHTAIPAFVDHFTLESDGDTRLYTVQELVQGDTLESLVAAGRHFTEDEVTAICSQVVEVLAYLHGRSPPLVHRDIKPSNIILDEGGTAHLVDFGSVRTAIGGDELDGKTIVGTYGYMPIEQYEARAVPQSDFYALGMTLLFVLSHREPTQIPRSGLTLDFRPLVNVSEGFAALIERMIAPAPEDRPEQARELLLELREPRPSGVGASRRKSPATRNLKPSPIIMGAIGVGSLLLALGTFFVGYRPQPAPLGPDGAGSNDSGLPIPPIEPTGGPLPPPVVEPVTPQDGVLAIDIYRDFRYQAEGWPLGLSVAQTTLPALIRTRPRGVDLPEEARRRGAEAYFGFLPLGNTDDARIDFVLVDADGAWSLYVDEDNNENLTDDGPPRLNEGSGTVLAATLSVEVDVDRADGDRVSHPYHLWVWFDQVGASVRGRFYARNHFRGLLEVDGVEYLAVAFEYEGHDALYRESGLCIDLDGDGECQDERELFYDGSVLPFPGAPVTLRLDYP